MPKTGNILTVDNPIPTWKGPLETEGFPEILTISASAPPLSGADQTEIDFHCAETISRDGGIIDTDKIAGTIFDDQS